MKSAFVFLMILSTSLVAASAQAYDLENGKKLYRICENCHGSMAQGDEIAKAPRLAGQDPRYIERQYKKFRDGIRGAHPDDTHGLRMRPMGRMLQSDADIQ